MIGILSITRATFLFNVVIELNRTNEMELHFTEEAGTRNCVK